jgi:hypothetical protein
VLNEVVASLENENKQLIKDFEERTEKIKFELISIHDQQLMNLFNSKHLFSPSKSSNYKSTGDLYQTDKLFSSLKESIQANKDMMSPLNQNKISNPFKETKNSGNFNSDTITSAKLTHINELIFSLEKNIPDLRKKYHSLSMKLGKKNLNEEKLLRDINDIEASLAQKLEEANLIEKDVQGDNI